MRSKSVSGLAAGAVVLVCSVVQADVPKAEDIAACNREAQEAVRSGSASSGSASPTTKDTGRAADARRDDAATSTMTRSRDPQVEGMEAEGAKNPVYQAVYRTCMRRSGF